MKEMGFMELLFLIGDIFGSYSVVVDEDHGCRIYFRTNTKYPYMRFALGDLLVIYFEPNIISIDLKEFPY